VQLSKQAVFAAIVCKSLR